MVISQPQTQPSVSSFKKRFALFAPYLKSVKLCASRGFGEAQVIVVANLREEERSLELPLSDGHWHEILFDYSLDAPASESVPGLSAKMYTHA